MSQARGMQQGSRHSRALEPGMQEGRCLSDPWAQAPAASLLGGARPASAPDAGEAPPWGVLPHPADVFRGRWSVGKGLRHLRPRAGRELLRSGPELYLLLAGIL